MITIRISGDSRDGQFKIIAGGLNLFEGELDPSIKGSEVYCIIGNRIKKQEQESDASININQMLAEQWTNKIERGY